MCYWNAGEQPVLHLVQPGENLNRPEYAFSDQLTAESADASLVAAVQPFLPDALPAGTNSPELREFRLDVAAFLPPSL